MYLPFGDVYTCALVVQTAVCGYHVCQNMWELCTGELFIAQYCTFTTLVYFRVAAASELCFRMQTI